MRTPWWVAAVFAIAGCAVLGAYALPLVQISGSISSDEPLRARIHNIPTTAWSVKMLVGNASLHEPFLDATAAEISIVERRFMPSGAGAGAGLSPKLKEALGQPPGPGVSDPFAPREVRRFHAESVGTVLEAVGPTSWVQLTSDGGAEIAISPGTECELSRVESDDVLGPRVRATCPLEGHASGAYEAVFYGPEVVLTYWSQGRWHEETVATGLRAERASGHALPAYVARTLRVEAVKDSWAAWRNPSHAELQAPRVATAGDLLIPAGRGALAWGTSHLGPHLEALTLQGSFTVAGQNGSLAILGAGAPPTIPATVAARDSAPDPGVPVWVWLAAGSLLIVFRSVWAASVGLFTRLNRSTALEHEGRRIAVEYVTSNPGATIRDIAQTLGIDWTTARHHVRILAQQGLVTVRKVGQATVILPGSLPAAPQATARMAALRKPRVQALMALLRERADWTQQELAAQLGIRRTVVSYHLNELQRVGLVRVEPLGRRRRYHPTA